MRAFPEVVLALSLAGGLVADAAEAPSPEAALASDDKRVYYRQKVDGAWGLFAYDVAAKTHTRMLS